jgi:hypothetical protein
MEANFYSMQVFPEPSKGDKNVSIFVILYDEDLEDCDLGYYDFKNNEWVVMGDFSMKLKCWCNVPKPIKNEVYNYKISYHRGYR